MTAVSELRRKMPGAALRFELILHINTLIAKMNESIFQIQYVMASDCSCSQNIRNFMVSEPLSKEELYQQTFQFKLNQ